MIISTPLSLNKLVPDDWEKWWNIWHTHSRPLVKSRASPNSSSGLHHGFDVYKCSDSFRAVYSAPYIDLSTLYPSLFEQVMALPINVYAIRFVMSLGNFPAHIDNKIPNWQIRNLFWCEDPEPQWYYTKLDEDKREFLQLPPETNWWAYLDGAVKHGTVYRDNYKKILIQVFSDTSSTKKYALQEIPKFPQYTMSI
mgnify:CR=1 FL=1